MEVNVVTKGFVQMSDEDAEVFRQRMQEIAKNTPDGIATPEAIIEDARKKNSPIHRFYEWDKDIAFEQYLLDRTRHIVKSIQYAVHYNQQVVAVRAFEHVTSPGGVRGYKAIEEVKCDEFYKRQVVEEALATIRRFEQKYNEMLEFFGLSSRVSTIRKKIEESREAWESATQ